MSKQTDLINIPDAITVSGSNVGIGTQSPNYDLVINNSSGPTLRLDTNLAAANASVVMTESNGTSSANGGFIRYNGGDNRLELGVGTSWNNTRMVIGRDTGNVGINETSPFAKLHISDTQTGRTSADSVGNLLVLEDDENGMSILSANAGAGYILFGDPADTAAGGIVYDHSADRFRFRTGSTWDRMIIDSSGRVTMPYQPSFLAHTMTGFNSSSNIMKNFVTMQHNTGGHFNNSTGYFTAPVAGKYLVNSGVLVATGTGRLEFNVQINSSSPYLAGNGTGTTYDGPTLSGVFNLSANDTIRVILVSGSPHSNGNHPNTYFGVTLLG